MGFSGVSQRLDVLSSQGFLDAVVHAFGRKRLGALGQGLGGGADEIDLLQPGLAELLDDVVRRHLTRLQAFLVGRSGFLLVLLVDCCAVKRLE